MVNGFVLQIDPMPTYTLQPILGRVFTKVEVIESRHVKDGSDVRFHHNENSYFAIFHEQDCCEDVDLYDVIGDLDDLVGSPILMAEEVTDQTHPLLEKTDESFTWTFYRFATIKGHVLLRWFGTSNGYYSESMTVGAYTNDELLYKIEDGGIILQGDVTIQDDLLADGVQIAGIRTTRTVGATGTTMTTSTDPPEVYFHRPDTVD